MDLLRFVVVGSVDDGKSTLIGRLLYDSKSLLEDTYASIAATSRLRGSDEPDLALVTDGLRAEREQGITIDVAYRYFATDRRRFIIADTPGHEQYTRNMVTGASTADLAVVLIDARLGVLEQSKRHAFLASLLGIPHLVVCVNKMDLVDYDRDTFDDIRREFTAFARRLEVHDVTFIPISALAGDNIVDRSDATPWYQGPTLMAHLEEVFIASDSNQIDVRFPVQYVSRSHRPVEYRGFAGTVAGGVLRPGDEVMVLPGGQTSTIAGIDVGGEALDEAFPPMAVSVELTDDIDVGRGDMLCRPNNQPRHANEFDTMVCWMTEQRSLKAGDIIRVKHTTRWTRARVESVHYRIDVNTLHRDADTDALELNEIGRVSLKTMEPLFYDSYRRNRATGSLILVDEATNDTVGAAIVTDMEG